MVPAGTIYINFGHKTELHLYAFFKFQLLLRLADSVLPCCFVVAHGSSPASPSLVVVQWPWTSPAWRLGSVGSFPTNRFDIMALEDFEELDHISPTKPSVFQRINHGFGCNSWNTLICLDPNHGYRYKLKQPTQIVEHSMSQMAMAQKSEQYLVALLEPYPATGRPLFLVKHSYRAAFRGIWRLYVTVLWHWNRLLRSWEDWFPNSFPTISKLFALVSELQTSRLPLYSKRSRTSPASVEDKTPSGKTGRDGKRETQQNNQGMISWNVNSRIFCRLSLKIHCSPVCNTDNVAWLVDFHRWNRIQWNRGIAHNFPGGCRSPGIFIKFRQHVSSLIMATSCSFGGSFNTKAMIPSRTRFFLAVNHQTVFFDLPVVFSRPGYLPQGKLPAAPSFSGTLICLETGEDVRHDASVIHMTLHAFKKGMQNFIFPEIHHVQHGKRTHQGSLPTATTGSRSLANGIYLD